jgi:type III restriction enzyme
VGDLVIANPIINGPYDEPARHFRFDADGITDQVDDGRRPSSYFVPVPRPRKGRAQLEIPELTADQIEVNQQVNAIRARVDIWRSRRYDGVTPTTRRLLEHWADGERDNRILFAQREAAETAIYLAEARPYDAVGSTAEVDFFTTREVYPTSEARCHVSYVVLDGVDGNAWERTVAQALEALPGVAAYVKNDHLGFTIPYTHKGRTHQFVPDFLVRLAPEPDGVARMLVVEVSGGREDQSMRAAKADTARDLWLPAVNNDGRWGRWGFCEVDDPTRAKLDIGAAADALSRGVGQ